MSVKYSNRERIITAVFFVVVFAFSFAVLYLLNYVPEELQDTNITEVDSSSETASTTVVNQKQYELPIRISIDKIGVNSIVQNPDTTNVYQLDDLLLKGVVRYPGSGLPGEGNMFLFGHSTGLKLVNNQAFKAFNNLKSLVAGDKISIYSDTQIYNYVVTTVRMAKSSDVLVDFSVQKNMLTLSTCNTFGQKEDRYVVEADFVGTSAL